MGKGLNFTRYAPKLMWEAIAPLLTDNWESLTEIAKRSKFGRASTREGLQFAVRSNLCESKLIEKFSLHFVYLYKKKRLLKDE